MMTTQHPPPQSDWTKTKIYAGLILLGTLVGAGAALYQVWKLAPTAFPPQEPVVRNSPTPVATPSATPILPASLRASHQNVCGVWLSETSQKKYDFVCQGQDFFEIYEVGDQGRNKTGTGKITEDGNVEANLLSLSKNRKAQLILRLSSDGHKMEGSWRGDDPRESGRLTFYKV